MIYAPTKWEILGAHKKTQRRVSGHFTWFESNRTPLGQFGEFPYEESKRASEKRKHASKEQQNNSP